jgi:hypothetical protein
MKAKERAEIDYDQGHCAGLTCREKGAQKPKRFNARKSDAGSPVSPQHGLGFLDGLLGRAHRYAKGLRKSAFI